LNPPDSLDPSVGDPDALQALQEVQGLEVVSSILHVICETTGMGFSAVARVTSGHWTALSVHDRIQFGLSPGDELPLHTTLCQEVRETGQPIAIDHASADPVYRDHPTPRRYGLESYISVPIVLEDGSYFGNLCAIDPNPTPVSAPRIVSMIELFAQLIALQIANNRRRARAEAAVDAERATGELRELFIGILGHDLRNPLQSIGASAEVFAATHAADPDVARFTGRLQRNVRRMTTLLDDLGDLTRGRLGGGVGLELAPIDDLGEAFQEVIDELLVVHPDQPVTVRIAVDRTVTCDRGRLQQLASNLLANAMTHGSRGMAIEFEASIIDDTLVLSVRNDGEPIAADDLADVFDPFRRNADTRPRAGLGLGLYICTEVAKAHGGSLEVTSAAETGTRFTASIPADGPRRA
jgi:signal transduction histidine kinase